MPQLFSHPGPVSTADITDCRLVGLHQTRQRDTVFHIANQVYVKVRQVDTPSELPTIFFSIAILREGR